MLHPGNRWRVNAPLFKMATSGNRVKSKRRDAEDIDIYQQNQPMRHLDYLIYHDVRHRNTTRRFCCCSIFCPVHIVRHILSGTFCPVYFVQVPFVRYILSGTYCPVYFVWEPFVRYILSGMYCPDIFCPIYLVWVYFVQDYVVRVYLVLVYFVRSRAQKCVIHIESNIFSRMAQFPFLNKCASFRL